MKDDRAAIELAKDVGGCSESCARWCIGLGLTTSKRGGVDTVKAVRALPIAEVIPRRYQQSLDKWVFPRPQDLVIEAVKIEPDRAVMFIVVPFNPIR